MDLRGRVTRIKKVKVAAPYEWFRVMWKVVVGAILLLGRSAFADWVGGLGFALLVLALVDVLLWIIRAHDPRYPGPH